MERLTLINFLVWIHFVEMFDNVSKVCFEQFIENFCRHGSQVTKKRSIIYVSFKRFIIFKMFPWVKIYHILIISSLNFCHAGFLFSISANDWEMIFLFTDDVEVEILKAKILCLNNKNAPSPEVDDKNDNNLGYNWDKQSGWEKFSHVDSKMTVFDVSSLMSTVTWYVCFVLLLEDVHIFEVDLGKLFCLLCLPYLLSW